MILDILRSREKEFCEAHLDAAVAELERVLPGEQWGIEPDLNFYSSANVGNIWRNELRRGIKSKLEAAGKGETEYSQWLGDTHFVSLAIYRKALFERYRSNAGWRLLIIGVPRAGVIVLGIASHYQNAQNHNRLGEVSNLLYDFSKDALEKLGGSGMHGRKVSTQDWDQNGLMLDDITEVAGISIEPHDLFIKDVRTTTLKKVLASFISVKVLPASTSAGELELELDHLIGVAERLFQSVHPFGNLEEFEALRALALQDISAAGMRLLLRRKSATRSTVRIYYGPPGTGKTLGAVRDAVKLVDPTETTADETSDVFLKFNENHEQCAFVTFHPSLQYEDFVESIRPELLVDRHAEYTTEDEGELDDSTPTLQYKVHEGILLRMIRRAARSPEKEFVIVIDEINRGDVSRILGPLISSIDSDKRAGAEFPIGIELQFPRSEELESRLFMPSNLHLLGTMNSSDRNVALVDHALRRRFEFVHVPPEPDLLPDTQDPIPLSCAQLLRTINARIEYLLDSDHCIGHGYLIGCTTALEVVERFARRVIPLLREYFYGNEGLVLLVLGDSPAGTANFFFSAADDGHFKRVFGMVQETAAAYGFRRSLGAPRNLELDPRFWNTTRLIPGPDDPQYAERCLRKLAAQAALPNEVEDLEDEAEG